MTLMFIEHVLHIDKQILKELENILQLLYCAEQSSSQLSDNCHAAKTSSCQSQHQDRQASLFTNLNRKKKIRKLCGKVRLS